MSATTVSEFKSHILTTSNEFASHQALETFEPIEQFEPLEVFELYSNAETKSFSVLYCFLSVFNEKYFILDTIL